MLRALDVAYVDTGRSREEGGVGLGLAIARWAVEANGGHIELVSAVGDGSTFSLVVPRALPPESERGEPVSHQPHTVGTRDASA